MANGAILTIAHTTIAHNDYVLSNNGTATLTASTVSDNDSTGVGTGFGQTTVKDSNIADNTGIGVAAFTGTTSVTDTTIVGNQFHGVASAPNPYAGAPAIDITDNTIADNAPDGLDGNLQPGGIRHPHHRGRIHRSNNTTNDAPGSSGGGGLCYPKPLLSPLAMRASDRLRSTLSRQPDARSPATSSRPCVLRPAVAFAWSTHASFRPTTGAGSRRGRATGPT